MAPILMPLERASTQGVNQLPRPLADDGRALDPAAPIDQHFGEPARVALRLGAIVLLERPPQGLNRDATLLGQRFRQPDVGELGFGIRHPGHRTVLHLGRQLEQDVLQHDAGVVRRNVGELKAADDVADGIHPLVARAQPRVDLDALLAVLDAGGLEPEAIDIGATPGGDQHVTTCNSLLGSRLLEGDRDTIALRSYRLT